MAKACGKRIIKLMDNGAVFLIFIASVMIRCSFALAKVTSRE